MIILAVSRGNIALNLELIKKLNDENIKIELPKTYLDIDTKNPFFEDINSCKKRK